MFFDDVRVPGNHRPGDENQSWTVTKNLLGNERLLVLRVAENRRILSCLREVTAQETARNIELEDGHWRQLAELLIRLEALESTALHLLTRFDSGGTIGAEPSMLKLKGSQLVQDLARLLCDTIGYYNLPLNSTLRRQDQSPIGPVYSDMIASGLFHHRGFTLAGGSSEIQHNIIAQAVLGL